MSGAVISREALLVHTLAILSETSECYEMFADQLKVANNSETAEIFDELAEVHQKRSSNLEAMMKGLDHPHIAPWEFTWGADHSPEIPTIDAEVHYLMTPYHALTLAVDVEQWGIEFFNWVEESNDDDQLKAMARQFSHDAEKFMMRLRRRQESFPSPAEGWDDDPDPPLMQE
jgi:hypothetical protein